MFAQIRIGMDEGGCGVVLGAGYVDVVAHAAGACGPNGLPLTPNAVIFAGVLDAYCIHAHVYTCV